LVGLLGGGVTLGISGVATVLLAGAGALFWREAGRDPAGVTTGGVN
jgi:hypothetical protein